MDSLKRFERRSLILKKRSASQNNSRAVKNQPEAGETSEDIVTSTEDSLLLSETATLLPANIDGSTDNTCPMYYAIWQESLVAGRLVESGEPSSTTIDMDKQQLKSEAKVYRQTFLVETWSVWWKVLKVC